MIEQPRIAVWFQKVRCKLDGNEFMLAFYSVCSVLVSVRIYCTASLAGKNNKHPPVLERFYLIHGIGFLPAVSANLPMPS